MNNNSSHGNPVNKQKNKTSKKKTSNKNKNVTKVYVQPPKTTNKLQSQSFKNVSAYRDAIYNDVMHLQQPGEAFLVPRLSGAKRVPHLFNAVYNPIGLTNPSGAIAVRPQMENTLTEYVTGDITTPVVSLNKIRSATYPSVPQIAAGTSFCAFDPIIGFASAPGEGRISIPCKYSPLNSFFSVREEGRLFSGLSYYPITLNTTAAQTFTFRIVPTPSMAGYTGACRIVDNMGNVLATTPFTYAGPLLSVSVVLPIGTVSNIAFVVTPSVGLTDHTLAFTVIFPAPNPNFAFSTTNYAITYDMAGLMQSQAVADDYAASSTSSCTALWTLLQNQTAELYKMGRIGHCQLPSESERFFPTDPIEMLEFMSVMPALSKPNLPLATGGQRSYMFEDIEQLAFKNWKLLEYADLNNPLPTLVYAWTRGPETTPTPLQLTMNVSINVEYFTTSPVASGFYPPPFCFSLFNAAHLAMMESECGEDMGGENPKHLDRMKRIARKVASNPQVQRLAKEAGRSFLTFAMTQAPKLLL